MTAHPNWNPNYDTEYNSFFTDKRLYRYEEIKDANDRETKTTI